MSFDMTVSFDVLGKPVIASGANNIRCWSDALAIHPLNFHAIYHGGQPFGNSFQFFAFGAISAQIFFKMRAAKAIRRMFIVSFVG